MPISPENWVPIRLPMAGNIVGHKDNVNTCTGGASIRYKKGPAVRYKKGPSIRYICPKFRDFFL